MALKRFTDNAQTPEKKRVAIPLTSSADNTDYYATGADMAEIVLNNTSRLWDLKATVLPTCRSFRDREYLKAGSWFFEDISNTEDKPDKLKEKNVQFARLLCEEGQSAQEGLKFVKQYLFYVNMTDNELELSMRGLLLNGGGEVQGATPWKTGVDEADVAKEAINAKSADIATDLKANAKIGNDLVSTIYDFTTDKKTFNPTEIGWYRVFKRKASGYIGGSLSLCFGRAYISQSVKIDISHGRGDGNTFGNVLTQSSTSNFITKVRIGTNNDAYLCVDVYIQKVDQKIYYNIFGNTDNSIKTPELTDDELTNRKMEYNIIDGVAINGVPVATTDGKIKTAIFLESNAKTLFNEDYITEYKGKLNDLKTAGIFRLIKTNVEGIPNSNINSAIIYVYYSKGWLIQEIIPTRTITGQGLSPIRRLWNGSEWFKWETTATVQKTTLQAYNQGITKEI